jgi:hypothetical protein
VVCTVDALSPLATNLRVAAAIALEWALRNESAGAGDALDEILGEP